MEPIDRSSTQVRIVACPSEKIKTFLNQVEKLGFTPDWLSTNAMALYRYCRHFYPDALTCIAIYMGFEETSIISMTEKQLSVSSSIPLGFRHFQEAGADIISLKKQFINDLDRCTHFIKGKCKTALHYQTLTLGRFDDAFEEEDFLENRITKRPDKKNDRFAIAIGLALDTLANDKQTIQLRKGTFTPSSHLGKLGKKLCYCFLLANLLTLSTFFLSKSMLSKKERALEASLDAFIKNFSINTISLSHEKKPVKRIEYKLKQVKHQIVSKHKFFPVFSKAPNVSRSLAFFAEEPLFKHVNITRFTYDLVKYPTIKKLFAPCDAIVRLYMEIPQSSQARQVHDFLKQSASIVDHNHDILWERSEDGYIAQFHLTRTDL